LTGSLELIRYTSKFKQTEATPQQTLLGRSPQAITASLISAWSLTKMWSQNEKAQKRGSGTAWGTLLQTLRVTVHSPSGITFLREITSS